MNLNHPRWEGHQFNMRRANPAHYNNSAGETFRIRNLHSSNTKPNKNQLNEWHFKFKSRTINMEPENHALSDDRHGLVINHLNEVNRYVNEESLHEFVKDVNQMEERMGYIKKNR